jgi:hypothetical protein
MITNLFTITPADSVQATCISEVSEKLPHDHGALNVLVVIGLLHSSDRFHGYINMFFQLQMLYIVNWEKTVINGNYGF